MGGGGESWKARERSLFEFYATRFFSHPRGLGGRRRDGKNWNISLSAFSSPPQQKKQVGTSFRSQRRREGGLFKLFRSSPSTKSRGLSRPLLQKERQPPCRDGERKKGWHRSFQPIFLSRLLLRIQPSLIPRITASSSSSLLVPRTKGEGGGGNEEDRVGKEWEEGEQKGEGGRVVESTTTHSEKTCGV